MTDHISFVRSLFTASLLAFIILSSSFASLYAQDSANLSVMTWNIRLDTPDDGPTQWKYRKKDLCNEILKRNPDFLGVQEAKHNQMKNMRCLLRGYKSIGVGRDDGKKEGEYSAIFFKKSKLKTIRSGTFWLSETPEVPGSRGWDAACNRVVTWAEFELKATGQHFIAFNTHFDHVGEEARVQSAMLIIKKLGELAGKLPIILTGDFNVTNKTKAYRILTFSENEITLSDTRVRSGAKITGPDYSFVGFSPTFKSTELIDYILVTWDYEVVSNEIYDFRPTGKYLSDHLPVIANLKFKN